MLKKWVTCLLCLTLMTALLSVGFEVSAATGDQVAFTLSASESDGIVTVSISLPEKSNFCNATIYLHYDPAVLSYIEESVYAGSISPKSGTMFMAKAHTEEKYVKCVYATGGRVTKGGVLLNFEFEQLSDAPSQLYLSFDECCAADDSDEVYDLNYTVVGCVWNNDGSVETPTGVTSPTTTEASTNDSTTQTSLPTMIVTDESDTSVTIPVITTTDSDGNSATVPVVVATDVNGSTVTLPVTVVTDTNGSVATIPYTTATDANGNTVTVPVAIVTNAQGTLETVPVTTGTDAEGNIVMEIVTTTTVESEATDLTTTTTMTANDESVFSKLGKYAPVLIGVALAAAVAVIVLVVTFVALIVRKKKNA